jgi:hypothetical protein
LVVSSVFPFLLHNQIHRFIVLTQRTTEQEPVDLDNAQKHRSERKLPGNYGQGHVTSPSTSLNTIVASRVCRLCARADGLQPGNMRCKADVRPQLCGADGLQLHVACAASHDPHAVAERIDLVARHDGHPMGVNVVAEPRSHGGLGATPGLEHRNVREREQVSLQVSWAIRGKNHVARTPDDTPSATLRHKCHPVRARVLAEPRNSGSAQTPPGARNVRLQTVCRCSGVNVHIAHATPKRRNSAFRRGRRFATPQRHLVVDRVTFDPLK